MEILNNIWAAISTENPLLVNIIAIPLAFIEATIIMYLFLSIIKISATKRQKIIYITLTAIISILSKFVIPAPFNIFINYVLIFIITKFIFKLKIHNALLATILPVVIFTLVVTLISNPFVKILDTTTMEIESIVIFKLLFVAITYLINIFIILALKFKNTSIGLLDNLDKKTKTLVSINFTLGFVVLCAQSYLILLYVDILPAVYMLVSFITLFAYFGITLYSISKVTKLAATTLELQNLKEYNETLQILHDNVRCFKHDFDNIITTLGGYIVTDDMEGLKKYYSQLEGDCQKVNNLNILNPNLINNPGVYSLLTTKYHKAEEANVKMTIEFLLDLTELKMDIYEFTRVLGILLDNAIEAATESEEKLVNVFFRSDERNKRKVIIVENSYKDKNIDTVTIFEKGVSGKENHTGLGLWEINKILNKKKNLSLFTRKTESLFIQQLEVYNNINLFK